MGLDLPMAAIEKGLARLARVPGRFQMVSESTDPVRVVVDYAHTDDALKNLLETARSLTQGRIVTVFGCGGDRDRTKRPLMGAVAARLSDLVVLTSDNPRSEDPERIIEEIKRGLAPPVEPGAPPRPATPFVTYPDRRAAIELAIRRVPSGRPGSDRRQGAREVSGRRHADAAVRRRRGRARGARTAPGRVEGVTATMAAFALTAGLVAAATGGRLVAGAPDRAFAAVSTDTRALPADALFVALVGPRFDGHDFVDEAIARGAAGVLVARPPAGDVGAAVIVVDGHARRHCKRSRTRSGCALRREGRLRSPAAPARRRRRRSPPSCCRPAIACSGIAGNLNNHIGLPLSLLELRHDPDVAVVELGMNHAGEIRRLVEIAEPDVRVWTNVGDAHIGHFASREAIAEAKAEILERRGTRGPAGCERRRSRW